VAEKKVSRKELLKEPDEFLTASNKVVQFVRKNPRTAVIGCVILFAALLAGVAVYSYRRQRQWTSHELFEKAYRNYRTVVLAKNPASGKQLDELFKQFNAIASAYPSELAGERALLYSGHVLYMKKDYKGALDRYTRMKSTQLVTEGLGGLVMYNIAMTRLALNEYEAAKNLFDQLSKDKDSPYRRDASASIGTIYEAMGKKKEAAQAYRQYLKMFPKAPDAPYVRARMAALAARE
jgi:predicted negative regulator of RcsB-dependent stress response